MKFCANQNKNGVLAGLCSCGLEDLPFTTRGIGEYNLKRQNILQCWIICFYVCTLFMNHVLGQ